jgi:hypothetical protein
MRASFEKASLLVITFLAAVMAALWPARSQAQTTNWVAYNNYRNGPLVPPHVPTPSSWGTGTNVTSIDMGDPGNTSGPLVDRLTGNPLTVTLTVARTGANDNFGALGRPMPTNTPMARLFLGICDLSIDGLIGVRTNATDHRFVTLTLGGLNPAKRYVFRGTTARNGGYGTRWSVATIAADGWTDAHINGAGGPGVLTGNNFPASGLGPGQAAWNSGANPEGAVVGWNDIAPFPDGTFVITEDGYPGAIPGGIANGPYGYAFTAMMLAEVEIVAPTITANPPATTTVEQNRPFSLSVAATGAPLNYQWYKQGSGEISGATFATYSVGQAQVSDSGMYYAVVYNALARRTSTVAQVTVFADTTAPTVETIFSYPTVDAGGVATLDQIIIEWNEPVTPASVSSPNSYTVPGGGNPASVIVTNARSVVLVLGTPLAEDRDYSVTLSGATDAVGNVAGSSSAPFHSWVSGIGNGLLMESYPVEDTSLLAESVLADPDYPNNPDRRDTLRAFDTRLVYPDDTREGYGARIRGVFIPPVSGDWRFFARMPVFGVVYLNPNGTDEAGKAEILRQSTQNAPYNWDRLQSSLVALRAGRAYYIEGLYKAATGADYFKVAARLAGTGVPTPVDIPDTQVDSNALAGAAIAYPLAPRNLGGALTIVQDLADVTIEENNPVTFSLGVNNPSRLPLQYQWFRNGSPVTGSNGPTFSIEQPTIASDNGAMIGVRVAKVGSVVTSRTARLTVVTDVTRPRAIEVSSSYTNLMAIRLRYSEFIEKVEAEDIFAYTLGPNNAIVGGTQEADRKFVTLNTGSMLVPHDTYQLTVQNVHDLAGLLLDPNPTTLTFRAASDLRLDIAYSGNNVVLSWPAYLTGFFLQQANEIVTPVNAINWTTVSTTPVVVNGSNTVSVSIGPANKIFRLSQ